MFLKDGLNVDRNGQKRQILCLGLLCFLQVNLGREKSTIFAPISLWVTFLECTPILGYIRDVRPEWVTFPGRKPANECKVLTKIMRMGNNFDIISPGNGWFCSKLNKPTVV